MNIKTTIGKTYAVTSPADCAITTPNGTLIAACPAGVQTIIVAPTAEIVVSDDDALITETFKEASAGFAAGGGASIQQENLTDKPEQTTLDNHDCYGMSCLAGHTGLLKNITLQTRDNRTVSAIPVYLKIWDAETKRLLATSLSKKTQTLGQPITWNFAPVNVTAGKQLLVTAHTEEEKNITSYKTGAMLGARVTPNALPSTGLIAKGGGISPANWIILYILAYKGGGNTTINGVALASQADLDAHAQNSTVHITAEERTRWNNKLNSSTFTEHKNDTSAHLTQSGNAILGCFEHDETYGLSAVHKTEGTIDGRLRLMFRSNTCSLVTSHSLMVQSNILGTLAPTQYAAYTDRETNDSYNCYGFTMSAIEMAPYGITEPCAWAGDSKLPLLLRGSSVKINNTVIDADKLAQLLANADALLALLPINN